LPSTSTGVPFGARITRQSQLASSFSRVRNATSVRMAKLIELDSVIPLVTTPTARPCRSTTGPPELPGLIGIWVWKTGRSPSNG